MKPGQIFWGVLLLTVGTLFLLDNLRILVIEWDFIWRLWPVLIILWGIAALVSSRTLKALLAAAAALLLGLLLYWFFSLNWIGRGDRVYIADDTAPEVLTAPFVASVRSAAFSLKTGAASVRLDGETNQLIEASTRTSLGEYVLEGDAEGSEARYELALRHAEGEWRLGRLKNEATVHLHPDPLWDVGIEVGATSAKLDLSALAVQRIDVESGAASIRMRLGDRSEQCDVRINSGASSIRIEIPESVGCEVSVNAPLSSKSFSGFRKLSRNRYETEGFADAPKRISIDFDVGVSSLAISRY